MFSSIVAKKQGLAFLHSSAIFQSICADAKQIQLVILQWQTFHAMNCHLIVDNQLICAFGESSRVPYVDLVCQFPFAIRKNLHNELPAILLKIHSQFVALISHLRTYEQPLSAIPMFRSS